MYIMKVECITTVLSHPSKYLVKAGWGHAEGYLTEGKEYDVLAVRRDWLKGEICYLLCDDNYDGVKYVWPTHIPAGYFVIKDNSIPASWTNKDGSMGPDFLLDAGFYESLTDSEPKAVRQFQAYLMQNTTQDIGLFK